MTNKEAINLLDNLIGMVEDNQNSDYDKALKMAIEALKQTEQMPLPGIFIAEGYDTVEDENGNRGFGVYIPSEKQIYVAGNVPEEIKLKALFHEIAHWAQDISGREFNEDEAERLSNSVYNALPFTSLREPRKILFGSCLEYSGTSNLPSTQSEPQWIPCSERLPEYGTAVLCYYAEDDDMGVNHVIDEEDGEWFINGVTAWMPLPEPFKPDDFSQHMNPPED